MGKISFTNKVNTAARYAPTDFFVSREI
jgi:hypothetical protein